MNANAGLVRGRAPVILLAGGIAAPLLYVAMNFIGPIQYPGYDWTSQSVSELSAIGAPSRPLWVVLGYVYEALLIAFGIGVLRAAGRNRALRVVGALLVANAVIGLTWPPMHVRGAGFTLTDTLHIVWTGASVLFFMLTMGFGAAAFGKRFRWYSIGTMAVHVVFGTLTGMAGPRIAANLPTPWSGVYQRINVVVYMIWLVVLATMLLRGLGLPAARQIGEPDMLPRRAA